MDTKIKITEIGQNELKGKALHDNQIWKVPFHEMSFPVLSRSEFEHYLGVILLIWESTKTQGQGSVLAAGGLLKTEADRKNCAWGLQKFYHSKADVEAKIIEWHPNHLVVSLLGIRAKYRDPEIKEDYRIVFENQETIAGEVIKSDVKRCRFVVGPKGSRPLPKTLDLSQIDPEELQRSILSKK